MDGFETLPPEVDGRKTNYNLRVRVELLEQLCRDCYYCLENAVRPDCMAADLHIKERMEQLGLLEGGENAV